MIDKIGTLDDAIVHVAGLAGLSDYDVRVTPRAKNSLEVLMEQSVNDEADRKGRGVAAGRSLLPAAGSLPLFELAAPYLKMLDPARAALVRQALGRIELLQREGVVLMMPEMMMGRSCRERVASGSGFSLTRLDGGPSVGLKPDLQTSGDPYGSRLGGLAPAMTGAAPMAPDRGVARAPGRPIC